ncbi:MAG: hypothetical protein KZQ89_17010 [Candidatus Thiodiazotropha sp. (ex Lucinoma kastoroae)]|nr:hypothetical protein [Candidatus Thiodiazotropha sp. (ex Troendleina suluensis)]MCU7849653.1 hypothetical protein [Candidatus Thiodiazotropha sp. (ex Lucinoma kastoroae)]
MTNTNSCITVTNESNRRGIVQIFHQAPPCDIEKSMATAWLQGPISVTGQLKLPFSEELGLYVTEVGKSGHDIDYISNKNVPVYSKTQNEVTVIKDEEVYDLINLRQNNSLKSNQYAILSFGDVVSEESTVGVTKSGVPICSIGVQPNTLAIFTIKERYYARLVSEINHDNIVIDDLSDLFEFTIKENQAQLTITKDNGWSQVC